MRQNLQEQIANLPDAPGVYVYKDDTGREIYVGKAKSLRKRVKQYFDPSRELDSKTQALVGSIHSLDYVETVSEVEALMLEARYIKDLQPKFNVRLRSNTHYPFVEITWGEDFPRVLVTRDRSRKGSKYYGPFVSADQLRAALRNLQRVFKFRSCNKAIDDKDRERRHQRPCLNFYIGRCSAPCARRVSREAYRANIKRLALVLQGKSADLVRQLRREMKKAAKELRYEDAAAARDQIQALESLDRRGDLRDGIEPDVPQIDLQDGPDELQRHLDLELPPVVIEGIDISHFQGAGMVASVVRFEGGRPSRQGYRRFRIRTVEGVDDYAAIREVVRRRYGRLLREGRELPDMILIDGGLGQLRSAQESLVELGLGRQITLPLSDADKQDEPARLAAESTAAYGSARRRLPILASLAKREEVLHTLENPVGRRLPRRGVALRMLQYVRDESHRFAQHYHHILQRKRVLK